MEWVAYPFSSRSSDPGIKMGSPAVQADALSFYNLQYFGHLMQRTHSLEKTLTLGKIEGKRRRG